MSESSKRGKKLELEVAKLLRRKLGARVSRDKRSGAGDTTKTDIQDYYRETPFDIECKDHETIKVKEWFRQALASASFSRIATLVFRSDENILAVVKFDDLVNLAVEIRDLRKELAELKAPVVMTPHFDTKFSDPENFIAKKKSEGHAECRAGHLADQWGYCQQLSCKFSRGYRPPKKKRGSE